MKNSNKKRGPKLEKKNECNKMIRDEIEKLINQEKDKTKKK
jgi:hypothetical protein